LVPTWQWIFFVGGIFASAFFSSAETALTALGEARVQSLAESGGRRNSLIRLWQKHPDRVLSALLVGNTMVNVGLGSLTALMADSAGYGHAVAVLTGVTTVILLIFGEITPKTFAKRHATGFVRMAARGGDTLGAAVRGTNEPDAVLLNFGTRPEMVLGLFSGRFIDGASLEGVILGPESFGDPPAGPFPATSVDITLNRQ